ncbi:MAG: glycosyltransferase [Acidobacteria bacterium]|nr:glycosyltransferase [Acidobacteriota bacterium]
MSSRGVRPPDVSVLICTYNRAARLGETLEVLGRTRSRLRWEAIVVDNASTDCTRDVVLELTPSFPAPLRYLFEPRQGKSYALNTGIQASAARVIAFTDDDVRIPPGWLDAATTPLLPDDGPDYTGGPVAPIWETPPPRWLDPAGNLGGTIAVKDHGPVAFVFEDRAKTPLGVNMAVRRSLIDRIGGFRTELGRRGNSLMGQEQAEFFCRSRAAGARGLYVPEMALGHHVPASRLTRSYYRRWWYWKGVSHARLHDIQPVTELGVDLRGVPRLLGLPRFMYGVALRDAVGLLRSVLRRDPVASTEHVMMLAYFVGYFRQVRSHVAPSHGASGATALSA